MSKSISFGAQVKKAIGSEAKAKRDGTVEYRRGYFYRPSTLDAWRERLGDILAAAGISATIEATDHWHRDPNKSYFKAIIRPKADN